jgi:hypothetical protein
MRFPDGVDGAMLKDLGEDPVADPKELTLAA